MRLSRAIKSAPSITSNCGEVNTLLELSGLDPSPYSRALFPRLPMSLVTASSRVRIRGTIGAGLRCGPSSNRFSNNCSIADLPSVPCSLSLKRERVRGLLCPLTPCPRTPSSVAHGQMGARWSSQHTDARRSRDREKTHTVSIRVPTATVGPSVKLFSPSTGPGGSVWIRKGAVPSPEFNRFGNMLPKQARGCRKACRQVVQGSLRTRSNWSPHRTAKHNYSSVDLAVPERTDPRPRVRFGVCPHLSWICGEASFDR
jgi:hypothetical protein